MNSSAPAVEYVTGPLVSPYGICRGSGLVLWCPDPGILDLVSSLLFILLFYYYRYYLLLIYLLLLLVLLVLFVRLPGDCCFAVTPEMVGRANKGNF